MQHSTEATVTSAFVRTKLLEADRELNSLKTSPTSEIPEGETGFDKYLHQLLVDMKLDTFRQIAALMCKLTEDLANEGTFPDYDFERAAHMIAIIDQAKPEDGKMSDIALNTFLQAVAQHDVFVHQEIVLLIHRHQAKSDKKFPTYNYYIVYSHYYLTQSHRLADLELVDGWVTVREHKVRTDPWNSSDEDEASLGELIATYSPTTKLTQVTKLEHATLLAPPEAVTLADILQLERPWIITLVN